MVTRYVLLVGGLLSIIGSVQAEEQPEMPRIEEGFVAIPDGSIFYKKLSYPATATAVPLVFINGGPGLSHDHLVDMARRLAVDRPVVVYDQLGCGKSVTAAGVEVVWDVPRFVEELACLLDHLGGDRWYVLGHSWGGTVALSYTAHHQKKVAALVLSSPLIGTKEWAEDTRECLTLMPAELQETIARHEKAGTTDSPEFQNAAQKFQDAFLWHSGQMPPFAGTFNLDMYRIMWGPYEFDATGTLKDLSLWGELETISVPMLFCYGQFDWTRERTARRVTQAKRVVFEECGHVSFMEQPLVYATEIRKFFQSCD